MDSHEMEQFLEQLTKQERHQLFMILRRIHLKDRLQELQEPAYDDMDPEI